MACSFFKFRHALLFSRHASAIYQSSRVLHTGCILHKRRGRLKTLRLNRRATEKALKDLALESEKYYQDHIRLELLNHEEEDDNDGCTLYIKNISYDVTKESLETFFPEARAVRMPMNADSKNNKGFAYIKFYTPEDAEAAIEAKQSAKMEGCTIFLGYAGSGGKSIVRSTYGERGKTRVLCVKNLSYLTNRYSLLETFSNCSKAKVVYQPGTNLSKGFGFVEFYNNTDAEAAYDEMQGQLIDGQCVNIEFAPDIKNQGPYDDCSLVVKKLNDDVTKEHLQIFFPGCREIQLPTNPNGEHFGIAYLVYRSRNDIETVLRDKQNSTMELTKIRLEYVRGFNRGNPQAERGETNILFVKDLSPNTNRYKLKAAFDGSTVARIMTDPATGRSRCFGFVEFGSAEDAEAAYDKMQDTIIDGYPVTIDFATKKKDFLMDRHLDRYGYVSSGDEAYSSEEEDYGGGGSYPVKKVNRSNQSSNYGYQKSRDRYRNDTDGEGSSSDEENVGSSRGSDTWGNRDKRTVGSRRGSDSWDNRGSYPVKKVDRSNQSGNYGYQKSRDRYRNDTEGEGSSSDERNVGSRRGSDTWGNRGSYPVKMVDRSNQSGNYGYQAGRDPYRNDTDDKRSSSDERNLGSGRGSDSWNHRDERNVDLTSSRGSDSWNYRDERNVGSSRGSDPRVNRRGRGYQLKKSGKPDTDEF